MLERICGDLKVICCATKTVRIIEMIKKAVCCAAVIFALCECLAICKKTKCR